MPSCFYSLFTSDLPNLKKLLENNWTFNILFNLLKKSFAILTIGLKQMDMFEERDS